jgi:hypothetical protein
MSAVRNEGSEIVYMGEIDTWHDPFCSHGLVLFVAFSDSSKAILETNIASGVGRIDVNIIQ